MMHFVDISFNTATKEVLVAYDAPMQGFVERYLSVSRFDEVQFPPGCSVELRMNHGTAKGDSNGKPEVPAAGKLPPKVQEPAPTSYRKKSKIKRRSARANTCENGKAPGSVIPNTLNTRKPKINNAAERLEQKQPAHANALDKGMSKINNVTERVESKQSAHARKAKMNHVAEQVKVKPKQPAYDKKPKTNNASESFEPKRPAYIRNLKINNVSEWFELEPKRPLRSPPTRAPAKRTRPGPRVVPSETMLSSSPKTVVKREPQSKAQPQRQLETSPKQPPKLVEPPLLSPTPDFVEELKLQGYVDLKYQFSNGKWDYVCVQEIARLQNNVYFDDSLVMFLLKYFLEKHLPSEFGGATHLFGTFFFPSVAKTPEQSVAKWTAKLDISKRLLIIPVHQSSHWSVLVVANLDKWISTGTKRPHLVLFDSLSGNARQQPLLFDKAVRIIDAMLKSKHLKGVDSSQVQQIVADVPTQKNLSDCGVFLVDFMNHLISQPQLFLDLIERAGRESPFKFSEFAPQQSFGRQELLVLFKDLCLDLQETKATAHEGEHGGEYESELEMFEV